MLNENYKSKVDNKELLIIVLDSEDNIIFKADASPLSSFAKEVFNIGIDKKGLKVYSNQLGIGLAELSQIIDIQYYYGTDISEPAKEILDNYNIKYDYTNIVDLVKSSGNPNKVCPIERKLSFTPKFEDKISYLKERVQ